MKSNYGQARRTGLGAGALAMLAAVVIFVGTVPAPAQTFTSLLSFDNTNGSQPYNESLVQGLDGNLYGTTYFGGIGNGEVFKLTPSGTISTFYTFCSVAGCADGANPSAALLMGSDGNFYGTTRYGGSGSCGVVLKLTRAGVLTTLHAFANTDGCSPLTGLMQASSGNFYGTTSGGALGFGTLFEISASGTFKSLHSFDGTATGGGIPEGSLLQASNGSLYGTTVNPSMVYQTTLTGSTFRTFPFSNFNTDPTGPLIQASNGNIYGTTSFAPTGNGTVFKMTLAGVITTVYTFCTLANCADGSQPLQGVIQASDGNFYGTASGGGANSKGTIFKLTPAGVLTTLHSFNGTDGTALDSGIFQNTNGTFFGVTHSGGTANSGTAYSLSAALGTLVHSVTPGGKVGARVIILGSSLKGATGVSFNGTAATFTVASATEITTTVPAGATSGKLTVTTPTTTLSSDATYRVTPQITGFSPSSGPVGTVVTITGVSLTQTTKVTFGGKAATTFTVDSDTQVTATVPTSAVSGKIGITTSGGTASSATSFTVN